MLRRWSFITQQPEFAKLWTGHIISVFGSAITTVALPLTAVIVLHATAFEMSALTAVGVLPPLLFGLIAGVWIDRLPRRPILIISDVGRALLLGSIPLLAAVGQLRIEYLYGVTFLAGLLSFLFNIGTTSFTPSVVGRENLMQANSATTLNVSMGSTVGPAIAGGLVQLLTAPAAILFDAISFVASAFCTVLVKIPANAQPSAARRGRIRLGPEIVEGLRYLFTGRYLSPIAVSATIGAAFGAMQVGIYILFMVRDLHLTPALVGFAVTATGIASLVGALLAPTFGAKFGPGPTYIAGQLFASLAGVALAAAQGPAIAIAVFLIISRLLSGLGPSFYSISQTTIRQSVVPDHVLGRVNSSWQFVVIGVQPLGALAGGALATGIGLRATIALSSVGMLLGLGWAARSPLRFLRQLPDQSPT